MKTRIKSNVRSALTAMGLHVAKVTPTVRLRSLIERLRPKDCGIKLIRVGGSGDGGYLIPDDLAGIEYCFSPGVSTVSGFENQLADLHIKSFLADYSVDGPSITRPEFTFDKNFLGSSDRDEFITLNTWKTKYLNGYTSDLLLQMDIEGYEYEVILSTPDNLLDQFRIVIIEFHNLDHLFDASVFDLLASCFDKLLKSFHVVHIHPNNCSGVIKNGDIEIPQIMEFTFLNKRRARSVRDAVAFPHILDSDNVEGRAVPLPRCWYNSPVA